jgi:hypothetical protein
MEDVQLGMRNGFMDGFLNVLGRWLIWKCLADLLESFWLNLADGFMDSFLSCLTDGLRGFWMGLANSFMKGEGI